MKKRSPFTHHHLVLLVDLPLLEVISIKQPLLQERLELLHAQPLNLIAPDPLAGKETPSPCPQADPGLTPPAEGRNES